MATYITVDGGTTNTRLYLVRGGNAVCSKNLGVGARNGEDALKNALKSGISELLSENSLCENDIERIIASGMITSEYGLCNLTHASLPAGMRELREAMYETSFPDICDIPWCFIRGVRSSGDSLEDCDVMRGEETELMGLIKGSPSDALYILPGSHSKHISVDKDGKIIGFATMMTGEFFAAVMQNTILRDAADFEHNTIIEQKLFEGYEYACSHGVNEALFKTRILKNIFGATKEECYSFLLGAVLCDEICSVLKSEKQTVIIGGQKQFRLALSSLLRRYGEKQVVTLSDEAVANSTALGAVSVFET